MLPSLLAASGAAAIALVAIVHAVALRDAARRRPDLEAVCADHEEEPIAVRDRVGGFVAECLLTVVLPLLGLLGPRDRSAPGTAPAVVIVTPRWGRGLAWPLAAWLAQHGRGTLAVAATETLLTPSLAAIDAAVRRAAATTGGTPVDLVAFGAAGLAARIYTAVPSSPIRQLVTVATPHHGTHARWPFGSRRLRPDGAWVTQADAAGGRADVPCTVIYSIDDPALLPATNAYLHGALAIEVRGLGHVASCAAPRVLGLVTDALDGTSAATLPVAS